MGKRPYYIIKRIIDHDGYECYIDYLGTNYKAALDRYYKLIDYIRERDFLNEGVGEDAIEMRLAEVPVRPLGVGESIYSYLNDNDYFYESIELTCVKTNSFSMAIFENRYKQEYPNSKY